MKFDCTSIVSRYPGKLLNYDIVIVIKVIPNGKMVWALIVFVFLEVLVEYYILLAKVIKILRIFYYYRIFTSFLKKIQKYVVEKFWSLMYPNYCILPKLNFTRNCVLIIRFQSLGDEETTSYCSIGTISSTLCKFKNVFCVLCRN